MVEGAGVQAGQVTGGDELNVNDPPRCCLACGYDLSHLGPEPRCPECGLRHVPQGYREQTWEYVDSGQARFVGPFGLFRKRPPGWWWSLDRPGDVRRSIWYLAINLFAAMLITSLASLAFGGVAHEVTNVYTLRSSNGTTFVYGRRSIMGAAGFRMSSRLSEQEATQILRNRRGASIGEIRWVPHMGLLTYWIKMFFAWLIWVWAFPVGVGLMSQIRKGLPDYAHPPSTILVAGNYESIRLVCGALGLALCMGVDAWLRINMQPFGRYLNFSWHYVVIGVLIAASWIGPLRSDPTNQLIRSRMHRYRIVFMYGLFMPALVYGSINLFINTFIRHRFVGVF